MIKKRYNAARESLIYFYGESYLNTFWHSVGQGTSKELTILKKQNNYV